MIYASAHEWNRWSSVVNDDKKDLIFLSISKKHPMFKTIVRELNTLKKTIAVHMNPMDYIGCINDTKDSQDYIKPPMLIGYRKGEAVLIAKEPDLSNNFDDIMNTITCNFI